MQYDSANFEDESVLEQQLQREEQEEEDRLAGIRRRHGVALEACRRYTIQFASIRTMTYTEFRAIEAAGEKKPLFIDVRSPEEQRVSMIKGAVTKEEFFQLQLMPPVIGKKERAVNIDETDSDSASASDCGSSNVSSSGSEDGSDAEGESESSTSTSTARLSRDKKRRKSKIKSITKGKHKEKWKGKGKGKRKSKAKEEEKGKDRTSDRDPLRDLLLVPYCTVGYRSGHFATELVRAGWRRRQVFNGLGVVPFSYEAVELVRGSLAADPGVDPREGEGVREAAEEEDGGAKGVEEEGEEVGGNQYEGAPTTAIHVYGSTWDLAHPDYLPQTFGSPWWRAFTTWWSS